jgi:hypothetical protein
MTAGVACKFTSQNRSPRLELSIRKNPGPYSLADIAALGFAISFMTSASVALADGFFTFLLLMPS